MTSSVATRSINNDTYDPDKVNKIRLKVNRVNLIQTVDVDDELLSKLRHLNIIDSDEMFALMSRSSREDKIRALIDCLSARDHVRKDWYALFRKILIERNYTDLVTFLDNTIIKKPNFVNKFYSSSSMSTRRMLNHSNNNHNEFFSENMASVNNFVDSEDNFSNRANNFTLPADQFNENNFDVLLKKFPTYSIKPISLLKELELSKEPDDHKQLDLEYEAFNLFQKLELLCSYHKSTSQQPNNSSRKTAGSDMIILDTQTFKHILNVKHVHVYMKHIKNLNDLIKFDILKYLTECLVASLRERKPLRVKQFAKLDDLVFKFALFLISNERHEHANQILEQYLVYLKQQSVGSESETQSSRFYALSHLVVVKNNMYDFKSAFETYDEAIKLYKSASVSGITLNPCMLYYAIGCTYYEIGKYDHALDCFNQALRLVTYETEILIDLLGASSLCLCSKWMIREGETLAVLGIKAAKQVYGTNSYYFVKALLYYAYFSNEFCQDMSTIEICEFAIKMSKRVFGFESVLVADAYKVSSKALTTNKIFDNSIYHDHAQKALKIASEFYSTTNNPKLIGYEVCLVSALQWKSINAQQLEVKKMFLNDAYNLCIQTIKLCLNIYGQENTTTAKLYRMLGSLLYYMQRDAESEEIHKFSLDLMETLFSSNSLHFLLAKSTLGVFYKLIGQVNDAIVVFLEVVEKLKLEEIRHLLGYCKWIPSVYSNLSDCYTLKKVDDMATHFRKQADNLKIIASNNLVNRFDVLGVEIEQSGPPDLARFLIQFIDSYDESSTD